MPVELTEKNYEQYVNDKSNVFIDFWAEWCGPCKRMKPEFHAAETFMNSYTNTQLTFASVNVDEQENIAFKFSVELLPTLLLVKDGKLVEKSAGFRNKEDLLLIIGKHFDVTEKTPTENTTVENAQTNDVGREQVNVADAANQQASAVTDERSELTEKLIDNENTNEVKTSTSSEALAQESN